VGDQQHRGPASFQNRSSHCCMRRRVMASRRRRARPAAGFPCGRERFAAGPPLAHAAGKLARHVVAEPGQPEAVQQADAWRRAVRRDRPASSRARPALSATVRQGSSRSSAACRHARPMRLSTSFPRHSIRPDATRTQADQGVDRVDLPQPLGPARARNSPAPTVRSSRRSPHGGPDLAPE
jgi:hypothetical protein